MRLTGGLFGGIHDVGGRIWVLQESYLLLSQPLPTPQPYGSQLSNLDGERNKTFWQHPTQLGKQSAPSHDLSFLCGRNHRPRRSFLTLSCVTLGEKKSR